MAGLRLPLPAGCPPVSAARAALAVLKSLGRLHRLGRSRGRAARQPRHGVGGKKGVLSEKVALPKICRAKKKKKNTAKQITGFLLFFLNCR